jgi:hypothetical protein
MEIKDKGEYYDKYNLGLFGNRALIWDSYTGLLESDWRGNVCIRGKGINGIPRNFVKYNIPFENVRNEIGFLEKMGFPEEILRFNQSMPDSFLSIQGEVIDYIRGFGLTYTLIKKPMNLGLREETRHARELTAKLLLRSRMDPSSFEDLQALFEIYPEAAIEFSTYEVSVGDIPGRNTVFWEVRNY